MKVRRRHSNKKKEAISFDNSINISGHISVFHHPSVLNEVVQQKNVENAIYLKSGEIFASF